MMPGVKRLRDRRHDGEHFDDDGEVTDAYREARITVIIGRVT